MDGLLPFEVGFYGWLVFIGLHVWHQWHLIERKKQRPSYTGNFISRAFFAIICIFIMCPGFDPLGDRYSWIPVLPVLVYEVSSFYLLFDQILNLTRDKPIFYRGKSSGWIETYMGPAFYYFLKVLCLVMLPIAIIKMFS